jgi:hypothetical protein
MRICPTCNAFYADDSAGFCFVEGMPLVNVESGSDQWNQGTRVIEEKVNRAQKQRRRLKWRRVLIAAAAMLIATRVVYVLAVDGWVYLKPAVSSPAPLPSPSLSPSPTVSLPGVYQITGQVVVADKAVAKVKITLDGSASMITTTDHDGKYTFKHLPAGGAYSITPTLENVKFTARSIGKLGQNEVLNFEGVAQLFTISGHVTSDSKIVTIALSGTKSAMSKISNGKYSFGALPAGGNYTLAPSADNVRFTARAINKLTKDEVIDFVGLPKLFKISGQVTSNGKALSQVTVTLKGPDGSTKVTGPDGRYGFKDLPAGGTYAISASFGDLNFAPRSINLLSKDESVDFERVQRDPVECSEKDQSRERAIIQQRADQLFMPRIKGELSEKLRSPDGIRRTPLVELGRVDPAVDQTCQKAEVKVTYVWSIDAPGFVKAKMAGTKKFACHKTATTWSCQ